MENKKEDIQNVSNQPKSLKKLFGFDLISQIVSYLTPILTAPYVSRILQPNGIGQYSFANSIVSYFVMIVTFGFTNYGNKLISSQRQNKEEYSSTFWKIIESKTCLFVPTIIVYFLMLFLNVFGTNIDSKIYCSLSFFIFAAFLDITFLFRGLEKNDVLSLIHVITKIISVICLFLFVKSSDDLLIYSVIQAFQSFIASLLMWIFCCKFVGRPKKENIKFFRTLRESFFYFLPTIALSIYSYADKTMIGVFCTTQDVGYYEEANKIIQMVISVIITIGPIMLTRMSLLYKLKDDEGIKQNINKLFHFYSLVSFPAICGLYCIGRFLIPAFFGEEYISSINIMYCLIPLIIISPISNFLSMSFYMPTEQVNKTTIFYFIGSIINVAINFPLIIFYGAKGAAIASIISELIVASCFVFFSRKKIDYISLIKQMQKPALSALCMSLVLVPLSFVFSFFTSLNNIFITIILFCIGTLIYLICCLLFNDSFMSEIIHKIRLKK